MVIANFFQFTSKPKDDDGLDQVDSDTPRSGVATPVPDPSDKRLPGIMHTDSYFQVGAGISQNPQSGQFETPSQASKASLQDFLPELIKKLSGGDTSPNASGTAQNSLSTAEQEASPSISEEQIEASRVPSPFLALNPYPTPPVSDPPSVHKLRISDSISEDEAAGKKKGGAQSPSPKHRKSISGSLTSKVAQKSSVAPPISGVVTTSNVLAGSFSRPRDGRSATTPNTPSHSRNTSGVSKAFASYDQLQKLTDNAGFPRKKSHPPTPTRALSNQTTGSDHSLGSRAIDSSAPTSESRPIVPKAVSTAPVKGVRGKLVVKIAEARGLRRSKDPYVVAIFQRNELVSKGPRPESEDEDDEDISKGPMATIPMPMPMAMPMSRQGSESGGRSMAIPMKSRQSSTTSLTDYNKFKIKTRRSLTNPKWDTEAIL